MFHIRGVRKLNEKIECDLNVYKLLVLSFCWAQNQNQLTFFITVISFGNPYAKIYIDLFL